MLSLSTLGHKAEKQMLKSFRLVSAGEMVGFLECWRTTLASGSHPGTGVPLMEKRLSECICVSFILKECKLSTGSKCQPVAGRMHFRRKYWRMKAHWYPTLESYRKGCSMHSETFCTHFVGSTTSTWSTALGLWC